MVLQTQKGLAVFTGKKAQKPYLWLLSFLCIVILLGGMTDQVYADTGSGETPIIVATQEPQAETQPTEVSTPDTPINQETTTATPTPETIPTQENLPIDPALTPVVTETPVADQPEVTVPDGIDPAAENPITPTVEPLNIDQNQESASQAVTVPNEAPVLRAVMDPYFNREGQTFYFRTDCTGFDNCSESLTPISAAIDNTLSFGLPDDGIINVEGGHFSENVSISSLPGSLILKGKADGQTTYLDGNLIINGTNVPLSFLNFAFNGDVSVLNSSQIDFLDSIFNGDLTISQTNNLILKNSSSHAAATFTGGDELTIDSSKFDADVLLSSVNTFNILQSSFESGLMINQSTNGLISNTTTNNGFVSQGSDFTIMTNPLDNDFVHVTLGNEKGQVTVVSGVGRMASIAITGQIDDQDIYLYAGEVRFGEGKLVFNPLAMRNLGITLFTNRSTSVVIDGPVTLDGSLYVAAPNITVQNQIQARDVTLTGQQAVQILGDIFSTNSININSGSTLIVNGMVQSLLGDVFCIANKGIQINSGATISAAGNVIMDADYDRDGQGMYIQQAATVVEGKAGIFIRAADFVLLGNLLAGNAPIQITPSLTGQAIYIGEDQGTGFNINLSELFNIHTMGAVIIGDQDSRGDVTIGAADLSASDVINLSIFGGNIIVDQLSMAYAGILQLTATGYISSRNQNKTNISIPGGSLLVKALGFGKTAAPIRTAVDIFSALVNCIGSLYVSDLNTCSLPGEGLGGIYMGNHGDLTIGGQNGTTGLTSGGEIIILSSGILKLAAPILAADLVSLSAKSFQQTSTIQGSQVSLLTVLDPYFTRDSIVYYFLTDCATHPEHCTVSTTPISAALADILANGLPDDSTMFVDPGTYNENLNLTGFSGLTIAASSGTVSLTGDVVLSGSTDIRFENFDISGTFTLSNASSVGFKNTTVGVLVMNSGTTLQVQIGGTTDGTDYDQVIVSGQASLNGTLAVTYINGFLPSSGDTFNIISYDSAVGSFHVGTGLYTSGATGTYLMVSQNITSLVLTTNPMQDFGQLGIVGQVVGDNDTIGQFLNAAYFGFGGPYTINATINIADFFHITNGTLSIQYATQELTLSDGSTVTVNAWLISGTGLSAFVGLNGGTADAIGLSLVDVNFGLAILKEAGGTRKWFSLQASADSASIIGITGLTLTGNTLLVKLNRAASDDTLIDFSSDNLTVGPITLDMDSDNGAMTSVSGTAVVDLFGLVDLNSGFAINKIYGQTITLSDGTTPTADLLTIGFSEISAFIGYAYGTADELGISLTGLNLAVALWSEVVSSGTPRSWSSVMSSEGSATFAGLSAFSILLTSLGIQINKAATDGTLVDYASGKTALTVETGPGKTVVFDLDGSLGVLLRAFGGVTFSIPNFVSISADFGFEKRVNGEGESTLLMGAIVPRIFLGNSAESMGVELTNVTFAMILFQKTGGNTYAATGSGTASLLGYTNILVLNGSLTVKINKTGAIIDESVLVGATPVAIKFDTTDDILGFYGTVTLDIVNFISINANLGFEKFVDGTTTKLLIGASDGTIFLGSGAVTDPDAIGLSITGITVGVVLLKDGTNPSTYAMSATGDAALIGLTGLTVTGTFAVKINKTGALVDETINTGAGGTVNVKFDTADTVVSFEGDIVLSVASIFTLDTGAMTVIVLPSGSILMNIPEASLVISVNSKEFFSITAAVSFTISKADGFRLGDFRITHYDFMGVGADVAAKDPATVQEMFENSLPGSTPAHGSVPDATLVFPLQGGQIDLSTLNTRGYIDVTYNDYSGLGLNITSITDSDPEFSFSGVGVGDVKFGTVEQLNDNTFRYNLVDKDTSNKIDLFLPGLVTVQFIADAWKDKSDQSNVAGDPQTFTVVDGSGQATKTLSLGPLSLQNPSISINDFQFKLVDGSPVLLMMIGLGVSNATMAFSGGTTVALDGLEGAFQLAVDVDIAHPENTSVAATGAFSIHVDSLEFTIPDVLSITGSTIDVTYDPNGADDQEIVVVDTLSITITPIHLTGTLGHYTRPSDGTDMPGLVIRKNGFAIGSASIQYTETIAISTFLEIEKITAGVNGLELIYGTTFSFTGEIFIAADGAILFKGSTFESSITDGPDAGTEALRATLSFTDGTPSGFIFTADQFSFKLGTVLTLSGSGMMIDSGAGATDEVVAFTSLGAKIVAGPLNISGEMKNFAFLGDGDFVQKAGFGLSFDFTGKGGASVGLPSWFPVKFTQFDITWPGDINDDPLGFTLMVSVSMVASADLPFTFSGAINGIQIDMAMLEAGKFPIVNIDSLAVNISGEIFGGEIDGALLGGFLKLDADGNIIDASDTTTPIADSIFYMGVSGDFSMAGFELGIRFAFSSLGPLGIMVSAAVPILIDPYTGLTISDFAFGVDFSISLPAYTEASQLSALQPIAIGPVNPATWLATVQQQVINQYLNSQSSNTLDSMTAPMIIYGSVTIYSQYVSQVAFNGVVQLQISTDGKFFAYGDLRLADNKISLGSRLYANFSELGSGDMTILFLSNIPDQVNLLVLSGELALGRDSDAFTITLAGDIALYNPLNNDQLFDIEGSVILTVSTSGSDTRLMLDASGSISVLYLGTIASAAAEFILFFPATGNPQFWGVADLVINPASMIKFGLNLNVFAQLMVNTTSSTQVEALLLKVLHTSLADDLITTLNAGGTLASNNTLITQMLAMNIPLSGAVSIAVLTAGTQWRLTDTAGNVYILNKTLNSIGNPMLDVMQQKTFTLTPELFSIQMAGLLIIGAPNSAKTAIATEYFRLSGAFDMQISSTGFQMFAAAMLTMSLADVTLLNMDAMGLILIDNDGIAINLELQNQIDLGPLLDVNVAFFLLMNTTSKDKTYIVPDQFISGGYLSTHFINTYIHSSGGNSIITIHGGMPKPDGSYAAAGFYLVAQGQGDISVLDALFMTGSFHISISASEVSLQVGAAYALKLSGVTLFSGAASGGITIINDGLYGYLDLSMAVGLPSSANFGFSGRFQFQINTTSEEQTFNRFQLDSNGNVVVDGSGHMVLVAATIAAGTTQVLFGGQLSLGSGFKIAGYTQIIITPTGFQIQTLGFVKLGSFGKIVIFDSAGIYIDNGVPVFACHIFVNVNLSIPTVNIFGTGFFNINTSTTTSHLGIAPASFNITISGIVQFASILNVSGSVTLAYQNNVFRIALNNLSMDVFGFVNVTVQGFVQSDGQFEVYGSVSGSANFVVVKMSFALDVNIWNCNQASCLRNHSTSNGWATTGTIVHIAGSMGIDLGIASVNASFDTQIALASTYAKLSMAMTFKVKLFWFLTVKVNWSWSHTWYPVLLAPGFHAGYGIPHAETDEFGIVWDMGESTSAPTEESSYNFNLVWALENGNATLLPGGDNLVVFQFPDSLMNQFYFINSNLVDSMQMLQITASNLPAELPAGLTYKNAVQINLFKLGKPVTNLQTWDISMITFAFPAEINPGKLVVLYWNPSLNDGQGGWVRLFVALLTYQGDGKWAISDDQLRLLQIALENVAAQNLPDMNANLSSLAAVSVNNGGLFVLVLEE
jgi:hypothetical protein